MNKLLKIIGIFLAGCLIMEIVANVLFPDTPNVGGMVVDSLYKSPQTSYRLGTFQSYNFEVDSIVDNHRAYFCTINIYGAKADTTLNTVIVKVGDNWQINKLNAK